MKHESSFGGSRLRSEHIGHVLAAYAESRVQGAAVLVIGDVTSGVPERLLQLGARSVHAYDRDAARARATGPELPRAVVARPLPLRFEVRDGAFDAAIVLDMSDCADPGALARELARLVTHGGVVIAATPNVDATAGPGIPYEEFYDMFAVGFEHVRVAAEVPWTGVALAELGEREEDPAVTVDSQLAPEPPTPKSFVIIASQEPSDLDAYALFQLPAPDDDEAEEEAAAFDAALSQAERDAEEDEAEEALADAVASRMRAVEPTADAAAIERANAAVQAADVARAAAEAARADAENGRANAENARADAVAAARTQSTNAAAALAEARLKADVLKTQLDEQRAITARHEAHAAELAEARAKNARFAEELARAAQALSSAEARVMAAERALEGHAKELEAAIERNAEEHARELAHAEEKLTDRARAISDLEREVARRERIVRELIASLEEAQVEGANAQLAYAQTSPRMSQPVPAASQTIEPPPPPPLQEDRELRQKLESVALEMARYEGELLARDWRISELEQNLAMAESAMMLEEEDGAGARVRSANDNGRIAELERELDTLRRALAQEHDARKRAESGQELETLRAALAEKMALLEQMAGKASTN